MNSLFALRSLLGLLLVLVFTTPTRAADLLVVGGHYFDVPTKTFVKNEGIAIKQGRFVAFGDAAHQQGITNHLTLQDADYILPGLIDLHAHYNVKLFSKRREEFTVMPAIYLANGATVTFSAGEYNPEQMQTLRLELEAGEKLGPRLINSGPYYGRARTSWDPSITDDQIRDEVNKWAPKVGGFKAKQIRPEHLKVLIQAAHKHGLTVTGHLDSGFRNTINPSDAIEMGIDRVEHYLGGDTLNADQPAAQAIAQLNPMHPRITEIIRFYIEHETVFDATISAYGFLGDRGEEYDYWIDEREFFHPFVREQIAGRKPMYFEIFERIYQFKLVTIKRFFDAGGKITLGTDHVSDGHYLPGFGIHRELDAFVRAGIPAADAIVIATQNGADAIGLGDEHGSIATGKSGDLYIVRGNPLENIRHTRAGQFVIQAGNKHVPQEIFQRFKGKLGPKNSDEQVEW